MKNAEIETICHWSTMVGQLGRSINSCSHLGPTFPNIQKLETSFLQKLKIGRPRCSSIQNQFFFCKRRNKTKRGIKLKETVQWNLIDRPWLSILVIPKYLLQVEVSLPHQRQVTSFPLPSYVHRNLVVCSKTFQILYRNEEVDPSSVRFAGRALWGRAGNLIILIKIGVCCITHNLRY